MLMQGKVVIISGIGPGLGIELALLAAREGAQAVVLAARTASKLSDAAQQIAALKLGTQTLEVVTDISKAEDCKNLIEKTVVAFGRVDALINSAYIPGKFGTWERWDFDDWRKAMDVNLYGSLMLSREAAKVMKNQAERGAIVMVNSMSTKKLSAHRPVTPPLKQRWQRRLKRWRWNWRRSASASTVALWVGCGARA